MGRVHTDTELLQVKPGPGIVSANWLKQERGIP